MGNNRYQILFAPAQEDYQLTRSRFYKVLHCSGFSAVRLPACFALQIALRLIADTVFDGHRIGRKTVADDPETSRTFLRERRIGGLNAFQESMKVA